MEEIVKPSIGRIVHFYPVSQEDMDCTNNGAYVVPAIVTQVFDQETMMVNITVFFVGGISSKWSVAHRSKVTEGNSYWDWPSKK